MIVPQVIKHMSLLMKLNFFFFIRLYSIYLCFMCINYLSYIASILHNKSRFQEYRWYSKNFDWYSKIFDWKIWNIGQRFLVYYTFGDMWLENQGLSTSIPSFLSIIQDFQLDVPSFSTRYSKIFNLLHIWLHVARESRFVSQCS